jgi:hypothetical protein
MTLCFMIAHKRKQLLIRHKCDLLHPEEKAEVS